MPPSSIPIAIPLIVAANVLLNLGKSGPLDGAGCAGCAFIIGGEESGRAVGVAAGGAAVAIAGAAAAVSGVSVGVAGVPPESAPDEPASLLINDLKSDPI